MYRVYLEDIDDMSPTRYLEVHLGRKPLWRDLVLGQGL